jgi:hypothetical protein
MPLPINERRGLNREDAIAYLGVKGTYFDKEIRSKLHAQKLGTSLIFDKRELDKIFDELILMGGDVGSTRKGVTQWPKEPQEFLKQKMDDGGLTRVTTASDFRDVLNHLRRQRSG